MSKLELFVIYSMCSMHNVHKDIHLEKHKCILESTFPLVIVYMQILAICGLLQILELHFRFSLTLNFHKVDKLP